MQQSNTYVITFAAITTVIIGGLLALAATGLKDAQNAAQEKDTKSKILGAVMTIEKNADVLQIFGQRIKGYVVDANGDLKEKDEKGNALVADKLDVGREYKKAANERLFPVYEFRSETNPDEIEAYILPVYGNGLWDKIWGYIALDKNLEVIKGVTFDHKAETPGLGARISDADIQERYKDKKIFDAEGKLLAVTMLKSEKGNKLDDHTVDGMSGATMTAKGLNAMLKNYLSYYQPFFEKNLKKAKQETTATPAVTTDSVGTAIDSVAIDSAKMVQDSSKMQ